MKAPHYPSALAFLGCTVVLLSACRSSSSSGEPEIDPKEAQPREVVIPTEAEAARNDRFNDMRKRRYLGATTFDGAPASIEAAYPQDADPSQDR